MARRSNKSKKEQANDSGLSLRARYAVVIGIIVIVAAIGSALFYGLKPSAPSGFSAFQHSFLSSKNVGIYVYDLNSTGYVGAVGCATALIETIVSSPQYHRDPSTINFFVVNQSACTYSPGLGSATSSTSVINLTQCMGYVSREPSIFINYSATNSTVVRGGELYVTGNLKFLSECGISSEITAT